MMFRLMKNTLASLRYLSSPPRKREKLIIPQKAFFEPPFSQQKEDAKNLCFKDKKGLTYLFQEGLVFTLVNRYALHYKMK